MSNPHTILPASVPDGYFDADNVAFIRNKVADILGRQYGKKVWFDEGSVVRALDLELESFAESIPRMNQRAMMRLLHDYRLYQANTNKALMWSEFYPLSQQLYQEEVGMGHSNSGLIKGSTKNRGYGIGTQRFYFT